eukprot:226517_1
MSFSHGDSVIINGLKDPNYQSYNGQNGVIGEYFEDSKRYTVTTVRLVAKSLKLRLKNLKPALATPDYSYSQNHIQIANVTEDLPIKKLSVCPDNQNEYKRQQQEQEPDEKSESADDESIQQWQWFDKENRRWCVSPDISEDMSKLGVSKYCGGLMKTSEDTGTLYREATSITYKLRRVDPLNTRYPDSFEPEYTTKKTLHKYRNKSIMKEFYETRYLEDLKAKMNPKELQIINVYCNNNISCFDEFYAQKRCMEARMGPINEERLFRACFEKDRVFIQNNAFGNRYDDYGDIGRGLYFHTTPLRAIHFKAKTQWQSSQLVLIECIVLLGDCHDHIANNRWPNNRNGICYDSKRNGDGDCYVIRKKERAYPLYFIHYNTADAAQHPYY